VLVWIVEVEARGSHRHHASIDEGKLACSDETHVEPTSKEALCAELDETCLGSNSAHHLVGWVAEVELLCANRIEHNVEDTELASRESTDHDATCRKASCA